MILYTRPLLFAFLLSLGATAPSCKTPQKTTAAKTTLQTPTTAPQVTSVTMSRGYCFGKCPVYSIEVSNSGLARYTGKKFVEKTGVYEKTFDKAAVSNLLSEVSKARLDTMQNSYEQLVSDLPSVDFAVIFSNGKSKFIQNAHYGPQVLANLAYQIDALVKTPDYSWKRTAEQAAD